MYQDRVVHVASYAAKFLFSGDQLNQPVESGESLYIRSHRPNGVPVEVKAKVVRIIPASYGTSRIGVAIEEPKESWLRLFVAWIADDNIVEGVSE